MNMSLPTVAGSLVPPAGWLSSESDEPSPVDVRFLLWATLLAATVRLFGLTAQSLWVDELMSWEMVRPGLGLSFFEQIGDAIQGPLFLGALWPLLRLSDSELMMRLPSALAGVLAVPVFGLVAYQLLESRAARLAVLVLAINPFHVWYSQEARGYAFLMFFTVAAGAVFLDMTRRGPTPRRALLFGLVGAGAVWSNLSGVFLLLAMGLSIPVFFRPQTGRQWGWWALAFGITVVAVAPWMLKASGIWAVDRLVPGATVGSSLRGETTFTPLALPYSLYTFFYGYSFGPSLRELHEPDRLAVLLRYWPLLIAGILPVALGLLSGLARLGRRRWFLLLWILVPVLILIVLALRNVKPWNVRYVSVVLPWVLMVAALGMARLPRRVALGTTVLLLLLSLWSLAGYHTNDRFAKADLREAARLVEVRNIDEHPILVPVVTTVFRYYYEGGAEVLDTFNEPALTGSTSAEKYLERRLADVGECWVVMAREWYFDPGGTLIVAMARSGHLRVVESLAGVKIYHWVRSDVTGDYHGRG